ncbi:MAG TPA: hypothetical protein VGL72_20560 [Bryobacteraceae bacterium]|jgi:hypothetical protein
MTNSTPGVSIFAIEAAATFLASVAALLTPRLGSQFFGRAEAAFGRLARKRTAAVMVVGGSALLLRLAILPADPIPHPFIHDEFSYLLAADTFASGRLTNPTPPLWQHFESFHIDQQPTYMSMYPPAQGLVLAAGQRILGDPWFGVWLSCGVMSAAFCWVLQAWFPPGWAFLGGMLCVMRIALFSEWIDSYNGGAVPAIGGALVIGAFSRLIKTQVARRSQIVTGLLLAAGFAILANSRPWEGVWLGAGVIAAFLYVSRKKHVPMPGRGFWLPASAALAVIAVGMGYYNFRVFGNPLTLPYQINRATYAVSPLFVWQNLRPEPVYRHREMRDFYVNREVEVFEKIKTPSGFVKEIFRKVGIGTTFFYASALLPPLIMLPVMVFDKRMRSVVIMGLVFFVGVIINAFFFPRYAAPVGSLIYIALIQCMRHLRVAQMSGSPAGRFLVRMIVAVCVVLCGLRAAHQPLHIRVDRFPTLWYGPGPLGIPRATVEARIDRMPGKHLLLVRYSSDHDSFDEWVYNKANIDGAKVVWAREMGWRADSELIRHFRGRDVWLVEPDGNPPRVRPYEAQDDH